MDAFTLLAAGDKEAGRLLAESALHNEKRAAGFRQLAAGDKVADSPP
jgi:hypothetical protein